MSTELAIDFDQLQAAMASWTPEAKARAFAEYEKRLAGENQAWYCDNPRCDGDPHGDFDYQHARADQWPPFGSEWYVWLIISGRGAGKTRTGSEWVRKISTKVPRIALIGRRGVDVRMTMIEGPSGLIQACIRAGVGYQWEPSKKEFTFGNGAKAFGYSAEEPNSLRGPEHGAAWLDEPAHMPLIADVWYNLQLGLRVIGHPGGAKILCTSTPLPTKWLRQLIKEPDTRMVRVSTKVNLKNLDERFKRDVVDKLEGTRLGRQELEGEILEDVEGALWQGELIVRSEWPGDHRYDRIVVSIDPAGTANVKSDETGIVVLGLEGKIGYVLEDLSGKYTPQGWATAAINAYQRWDAYEIVAEKNYGGDMVKATIDAAAEKLGEVVKIEVITASRSKQLRAEPVVAQYERKSVFHNGIFTELEDEMLTWVPGTGPSPNRIDAMVHGFTRLFKLTNTIAIANPADYQLPARR